MFTVCHTLAQTHLQRVSGGVEREVGSTATPCMGGLTAAAIWVGAWVGGANRERGRERGGQTIRRLICGAHLVGEADGCFLDSSSGEFIYPKRRSEAMINDSSECTVVCSMAVSRPASLFFWLSPVVLYFSSCLVVGTRRGNVPLLLSLVVPYFCCAIYSAPAT